MSLEAFSASRSLTMGIELELQIVSRHDYDLAPCAEDLLRWVERHKIPGDIKPEITNSMIEIATGICSTFDDARSQLRELRDALCTGARTLNVDLCGGGTHAFQHWPERRIFDKPRFKELADLYGYLSKQFTVFGQHVHLGCSGADQALWLLHAMSRYIPHFIALSASSPYVQGHDTGFGSARLNSVFAFPLSGRAPFVTQWDDFGVFFEKMTRTGVVKSMKDFYWDIRPKPEYGTIEVRVMDVPLTVEKAAALAAYIQSLARYLLVERPYQPQEDDYLVYTYNRFQACRFGLDGIFVDPHSGQHRILHDDILETLNKIENHAIELSADEACNILRQDVQNRRTDASWLRGCMEREKLLPEVVRQACRLWSGELAALPQ